MDAKQFDQFVHGLARASTRRVALAGVLGALAGGLASNGADDAAAKRRKRKRKKNAPNGNTPPPPPPPPPIGCAAGTKPCGPGCIPVAECCGGCDLGETCCTGDCTNLETDGHNCGVCGNACETNACVHGACDCQTLSANCPEECFCAVRRNNAGTVCILGLTANGCSNDQVCGLGSVCMATNLCSFPCFP